MKLNKNRRVIKIFNDMPLSNISNNLFKNFYPSLIPHYYSEQITSEIINSQLEKLISNPNQQKNVNNKADKINISGKMNYLRQSSEKHGEWIPDNIINIQYFDRLDNIEDDYDSNKEKDSNDSYHKDESFEENDIYENDKDEEYNENYKSEDYDD